MSYFFRLSVLLLSLMILLLPAYAQEPTITIVSSQDALPYQQTIASFKETLKQNRPEIAFIHSDAYTDPAANPDVDEDAQASAKMAFALGSAAIEDYRSDFSEYPLLATMILNKDALQNTSNSTAIILKTSALEQLQWHRHILPNARRIGILFDPRSNQQLVNSLEAAAEQLNLKIIAIPISSAKDIPAALKSLGRSADSILGIADKTVYSGKTAKAVLLFSFRNRIPFVGLSSAWVKAGALYALEWDFPLLGQQCAAVALRILDGEKASMIAPQFPEKANYVLNLKTAKHMKLEFSQEIRDGAFKIYE